MRARAALTLILAVAVACSGSSGPTPVPTPSASPSPQPTPTATPTPTPSPSAASCPLGKGTVNTSCARHSAQLLDAVEQAVARLIQERPQLFNLADLDAGGAPRVLDTAQYYAGVVSNLQAAGYCANFDGAEIQIKNTNEFSEQYDVLVSGGHVRRGPGTYRLTCAPASFPVDPEDVIDSVRVAFYGLRCLDGRTPPNNGLGLLPVDCIGFVTATPKNKDNRDVPPAIHGPAIDWFMRDGAENVRIHDVPGQNFNKEAVGLHKGHFALCAVVKGVEGCLYGEVIE